MKVLLFLGDGKIGGQERALYQLLKAFQKDDEMEFGVAIGRDLGYYVERIKDLNLPIIYLNLSGGFSFNFSREVLRRMKAYDIHHLPDPSPNFILYSLLAGRGIKRVFTRRGGIKPLSGFSNKKKLKFLIQRPLLKWFMDGYSGNTINAIESIRTQYRIRDEEVFVLYNGIDFSSLDPVMLPEQVREEHDLSFSEFVIGTACRLVDWKRVDLLIRAFANSRVPNKKLLIFGDGPERLHLEQLTESLGLGAAVHFAGMVSNMSNHYQILDCFVLPSSNAESFGNAVVEAMYSKVPSVIMADSDGLREHVQHLETGYIAEDEEDLARQIEAIYDNPVGARAIAERASEYVVKKYSFDHMVRDYKNFYRFVF